MNEAIKNESFRQALLVEADCAIRILHRTLAREDGANFAAAALFTDWDLGRIGDENPDPTQKLKEALEGILKARVVFLREDGVLG